MTPIAWALLATCVALAVLCLLLVAVAQRLVRRVNAAATTTYVLGFNDTFMLVRDGRVLVRAAGQEPVHLMLGQDVSTAALQAIVRRRVQQEAAR